jgi:hypothetical protein
VFSFIAVWVALGGHEAEKPALASTVSLHPTAKERQPPSERPGAARSELRQVSPDLSPAPSSRPAGAPARLTGGDLFHAPQKYFGKPVILTDAGVVEATNRGALIDANGIRFYLSFEGVDRMSGRYFLKNCAGVAGVLTKSPCRMPLLVTLTGGQRSGKLVVKDVKIVQ